MKNNETLLTQELYESIINVTAKRIVELKKAKGESLNKIELKKEILNELTKDLKALKKSIRKERKDLRSEKNNLRNINNDLITKNSRMIELNNTFFDDKESYINLDYFSSKEEGAKKR